MDKAHVKALFRQRAEARGVPAATGRLPIARPAYGATEQTPAAHEPAVQALAAPEAVSEPAAKKQRVASEAAAVVPVPPPPQALPAGFFDDGSKPRNKAQPKGRPDAAVQDVNAALQEFKAAVAEDVEAVDERERVEQARVDPVSSTPIELTPSHAAVQELDVEQRHEWLQHEQEEFLSRVEEMKRKADDSRSAAHPAAQQAPAAAHPKQAAPPGSGATSEGDEDDDLLDPAALLDWRAKRAV